MSHFLVGPAIGGADNLDPVEGWGEVPESDRPLWSRYMVDHLPWFPGVTAMIFIADGVMNGGTRAPNIWKVTAAELHKVGFSPMHYYLLGELLKTALAEGDLDEAEHGYLFQEWFAGSLNSFRLAPDAWKPWLERLESAQSPRRALQHILKGENLPPLGSLSDDSGRPARIIAD